MRSFVNKIICFSLLIIVFSSLINIGTSKIGVYDYSWGSPLYQKKLRIIEESKQDYSTVFIGSSHTWRHINPSVFDSIVSSSRKSINSYNLGVHGMGNPENYYLVENLISNNKHDVKNIFITFEPVKTALNFLFYPRYTYCLDAPIMSYLYSTVNSENYPLKTKLVRWAVPTLNYFYKIIGLQSFRYTFFNSTTDDQEKYVEYFNDGYISLTELSYYDPTQLKRKGTLADTSFLLRNIDQANKAIEFDSETKYTNYPHIDKINQLIELSKEKGVELYFIIKPNDKNSIEWFKFLDNLKTNNLILLSDPNLYPELYQSEYFFDNEHYNEKGAHIFTTYLAQEYLKLNHSTH